MATIAERDGLEIASVPRLSSLIADLVCNGCCRVVEVADAVQSVSCLMGAAMADEAVEVSQQAKQVAGKAATAARRAKRALDSYVEFTQDVAAEVAVSYRAGEAHAAIGVDEEALERTFNVQEKIRASGREEAAPARLARQARHEAAQAAAAALAGSDDPAAAVAALTRTRAACSDVIASDMWAILTEAATALEGTEAALEGIRDAHRALAEVTQTESLDASSDPYVASALAETLSGAELLPAARAVAKEGLDQTSATLLAAQAALHGVEDILVECRTFAEQALASALDARGEEGAALGDGDGDGGSAAAAAAALDKARASLDEIGAVLDRFIEARSALESSITASITALFAAFS